MANSRFHLGKSIQSTLHGGKWASKTRRLKYCKTRAFHKMQDLKLILATSVAKVLKTFKMNFLRLIRGTSGAKALKAQNEPPEADSATRRAKALKCSKCAWWCWFWLILGPRLCNVENDTKLSYADWLTGCLATMQWCQKVRDIHQGNSDHE